MAPNILLQTFRLLINLLLDIHFYVVSTLPISNKNLKLSKRLNDYLFPHCPMDDLDNYFLVSRLIVFTLCLWYNHLLNQTPVPQYGLRWCAYRVLPVIIIGIGMTGDTYGIHRGPIPLPLPSNFS